MKRTLITIITMLLVISMIAGCAPAANESQQGAEVSNSAPKDTLNIGMATDIRTLVPMSAGSTGANDGTYTYAMFDTLIWRNEDGTYTPGLATEWSVSEDGLEYTLKIREGVTFHNGYELTADDVAFSFNLFNNGGENSVIYRDSIAPTFDRAEANGDTVTVYLKEPFAPFFNVFSSYLFAVLSEDYYNEVGGFEGYTQHPIGCGPYKFVSYEVGGSLVLEAYENYWDGVAPIKHVKATVMTDTNARIIALEAGDIDLIFDASVESLSKLDTSKGVEWDVTDGYTTNLIFFCCANPLTATDINFRKAVLSAIDYEGINEMMNMGYGTVAPISGAPGLTARPELEDCVMPVSYDVEAAKAYLANSTYVPGTEIRYVVIAGSANETVAKVIQGNLQTIGINCQIKAVDTATYYTLYGTNEFELLGMGIYPSRLDMNNIYQFYDYNMAFNQNSLYVNHDKIVELGKQGTLETDNEVRKQLYAELVSTLNEDAFIGNLYYGLNTIAWNSNLQGVEIQHFPKYDITKWSWAE